MKLAPCTAKIRRYLYDQWGIRIASCPDDKPHPWHGWVAANEDLRCPGVPDRSAS